MVKPDYTPAEREVIKKALMGAARGKGRKLYPDAGQSSGPDNGDARGR